MNSGSKSPKLHFLPRMMSQKKRCSKNKVEDIQSVQEESCTTKPNYLIQLNDFKNEYKKLSSNDFSELKKEYKNLINESMTAKENQYNIFSAVESFLNLNLDGNIFIIQIETMKISLSSSSFTNEKLDAVFISNQNNHKQNQLKFVEYIVCQDPYEDSCFDFFQMIWEHDITYIITLTKILKRKVHIFEYWTAKSENEFYSKNKITFKLTKKNESINGNLIERTFVIEKIITENKIEKKEVTQLQLTTSSSQNDSLLTNYEKLFIKLHEIKSVGHCHPFLFHSSNSNLDQCSMLICIDKIISSLVCGSSTVNIYKTMLELNQYRNLMLQQECHYLCIYEYIDWFLRKAMKVMKSKKRTKTKSIIENL